MEIDKKGLRRMMRARNRAVSAEEREAASARIFSRVESSPAFERAHCVAAFCALGDEPATQEVLDRWLMSGRRVVVPRVEGDEMQFYDYAPEAVASGAFGIAEPSSQARLCLPSEIDLVVVPGVAFTREGMRLGRGKGYYDKYLAKSDFRAYTVGVGYAHQLTENLPTEPHDRGLEEVICL